METILSPFIGGKVARAGFLMRGLGSTRRRAAALLLGLALVAFAARLPGLGAFMTADEQNWMLRSATFWHELLSGNPAGTFLTTHPGATGMWLIGAGIAAQEWRVGQAIDESNLGLFRKAAVAPVAITTAILVAIAAWLVSRLTGGIAGVSAGLLLALDPYLTGLSMIAHLDALLALMMLNAVLLALWYARSPSRRKLFALGVVTGLALATKLLPALWLFVFFGTVLLLSGNGHFIARLVRVLRVLLYLTVSSAVVVAIVWPALLTKGDLQMGYLLRDADTVVRDAHVALDDNEKTADTHSFFYARALASRTTPLVQALAVSSLVMLAWMVWRRRALAAAVWALPLLFLWLYAVGFLALVSLAAKQGDRYGLPALAALPVAGGMAIGWMLPRRFTRRLYGVAAFLLVALLLYAQWLPYTSAYVNPAFSLLPESQQGWGEGLDAAARYLNEHPLGTEAYVASWYPSVFGAYYHGTTLSLSSRDDHRIAFVVLYRNMYGRGDSVASDILREYAGREPLHVVDIKGKPYVWIYDTIGLPYFPEHSGELIGDREVGQTVPIARDGWRGLEVGMVNFSGRQNTHDVQLHVKEQPEGPDIRTVMINARAVADQAYQEFLFAPIADSAGKTYYVSLTSPASVVGDAVAVRFRVTDLLPGQMWLRRRAVQEGETVASFMREGDIAYRLRF